MRTKKITTTEKPDEAIERPRYYTVDMPVRGGSRITVEIEDIANACFKGDLHLGTAFIYMARAGSKPGNDYLVDLKKARRWIDMKIARIMGDRV